MITFHPQLYLSRFQYKEATVDTALLHGSILEDHLNHSEDIKCSIKLILIWDMGDSYGLTIFRRYFIDCVNCDISVKGVKNINMVIGIGNILHKLINSNGK